MVKVVIPDYNNVLYCVEYVFPSSFCPVFIVVLLVFFLVVLLVCLILFLFVCLFGCLFIFCVFLFWSFWNVYIYKPHLLIIPHIDIIITKHHGEALHWYFNIKFVFISISLSCSIEIYWKLVFGSRPIFPQRKQLLSRLN